ncbi:MAG: hypothetical protein ACFCUN_05325 [Hyphomicrobiaceae bacterium]
MLWDSTLANPLSVLEIEMTVRRSQHRALPSAVVGAIAAAVLGTGALPSEASSRCTRLPLSDVAFGREASIQSAREKLRDYANDVARQRGWSVPNGFTESNEIVSCEVYLDLGPLGVEYQCLVTTTFCVK